MGNITLLFSSPTIFCLCQTLYPDDRPSLLDSIIVVVCVCVCVYWPRELEAAVREPQMYPQVHCKSADHLLASEPAASGENRLAGREKPSARELAASVCRPSRKTKPPIGHHYCALGACQCHESQLTTTTRLHALGIHCSCVLLRHTTNAHSYTNTSTNLHKHFIVHNWLFNRQKYMYQPCLLLAK